MSSATGGGGLADRRRRSPTHARATNGAGLRVRPDLAAPLDAYRAALRDGPLDDGLLDRCEALVRCRIDRSAEAGEDGGNPRERAVLAFADQFVVDPHGIDDGMRDAVLDHCSTAELAVLVQWLALADGMARFDAVLNAATEGEA